jgi:hypothetical protein
MPRRRSDDEWEEADAGWEEDADDSDAAEGDGEPTVACPYCRRQIHEDAPRCPYCERHRSAEDAPPARKPWWILLGVLACLYLVYRWITG